MKKLKNENLTLKLHSIVSSSGCSTWWELEESLLLSNTFAPCVKDKEHHERSRPGSPVLHKL